MVISMFYLRYVPNSAPRLDHYPSIVQRAWPDAGRGRVSAGLAALYGFAANATSRRTATGMTPGPRCAARLALVRRQAGEFLRIRDRELPLLDRRKQLRRGGNRLGVGDVLPVGAEERGGWTGKAIKAWIHEARHVSDLERDELPDERPAHWPAPRLPLLTEEAHDEPAT